MGYFKIDRQLFDHWLWNDRPFSKGQAWIDLIGLANYEDSKTPYQGKVITCKRGTVYRSISYLADRWGWSRDKTRNFLKLLESDNMIVVKATTNQTTLTLVNYGKYQDLVTTNQSTNRQRTSQRADSEPTANHTRKEENKEYKESKEGEEVYTDAPDPAAPLLKIKYGIHKNVLLAVEEYDALVEQYGAEQTDKAIDFLSDHIQQNGYSAKSHAYALKRWVFDAVREADIKKQELDQRESRIRQMGKKVAFDIDTYEPQIWDFGSKKKRYEQG